MPGRKGMSVTIEDASNGWVVTSTSSDYPFFNVREVATGSHEVISRIIELLGIGDDVRVIGLDRPLEKDVLHG